MASRGLSPSSMRMKPAHCSKALGPSLDPKSIGVGQYQHDMNQKKLSDALSGVVEASVNKVGVDLNTASGAHPPW